MYIFWKDASCGCLNLQCSVSIHQCSGFLAVRQFTPSTNNIAPDNGWERPVSDGEVSQRVHVPNNWVLGIWVIAIWV